MPADYCPVSEKWEEEEKETYYAGSCTEKGSGEYGTLISYKEKGNKNFTFYKSKILEQIMGENLSDHSFCALSSLVKKNENLYELFSSTVRAVCFEMFCSSKSLTIKIHENYILCPRAGGKIEVEGYGGFLLCPDYNLICTGTKMCNDMFDCVEKKSEIKNNSYIYDYQSKTSQDIGKAQDEEKDDENNYELSDDGLCPKFCKICTEEEGCIKCKNDYGFVLDRKNNTKYCESLEKLNNGYYEIEKDIYSKCINNCDTCYDDTTCNNCSQNYFYYNNIKCMKIIENCEIYNNEEEYCEKCKDGFSFKENNRYSCFDKNIFKEGFYSKDEGIHYYSCDRKNDENFEGCKDCEYDLVEDKLICFDCNEGYIINEEKNICEKEKKINSSNKNNCKYLSNTLFLFFLYPLFLV